MGMDRADEEMVKKQTEIKAAERCGEREEEERRETERHSYSLR